MIKRQRPVAALTPTENMMNREPARYRKMAGGMEGGIKIRSGRARCISIRATATPCSASIGRRSPGEGHRSHASLQRCIRLMNQDVVDLYNCVKIAAAWW